MTSAVQLHFPSVRSNLSRARYSLVLIKFACLIDLHGLDGPDVEKVWRHGRGEAKPEAETVTRLPISRYSPTQQKSMGCAKF
jgi:hypothetical protein